MNEQHFITMPINTLFFKLALPGIMSMFFLIAGFVITGIFVGQYLGSDALAAVNLVTPIMMILFALMGMIVVGSTVKIAIKLGENDKQSASQLFSANFLIILLVGASITILGIFFAKNLIHFFIHDETLAALSYNYAKIFIIFSPSIMLFFAMNDYLKVCGKIYLSMALNIGVTISNIILNIIFLEHLNFGIEYAALATALSQTMATFIAITAFILKKYPLTFTVPKITLSEMRGILYNGSSVFFNTVSNSLMMILINALLLHLGGPIAVAAYGIVMYFDNIIMFLHNGIQTALRPVISYNLGANKIDRIFAFFKTNCIITFSISLVCIVSLYTFLDFFVEMFSNEADTNLRENAKTALTLYIPSCLFIWFITATSAFLTSFDKPRESFIINISHSLLFPLISLFIMKNIFSVNGIYLTPSTSTTLAFFVSLYIWKKISKKMIESYTLILCFKRNK